MRRGSLPFTIWFYLIREFLFSFFVAFLFFFFIFFVNQILLLAEKALLSNIPFWAMIRLMIYALPTVISYAAPFGSLVGCLMAVGRLSSDHEMVSLRATGFSTGMVFIPFLLLGIAISVFSFYVNDSLLPIGTNQFRRLYAELFFRHPELELQPYSVKKYQDDIIVTGGYNEGIFDSLFIVGPNEQGNLRVISANKGRLGDSSLETSIVAIVLNDVEIHVPKRDILEHYDYTRAKTLQYNFLISDIASSWIQNPIPQEMSAKSVLDEIRLKEIALDETRVSYQKDIERAKAALGVAILHAQSDTELMEYRYESYQETKKQVPTDASLQIYKLEYHKKYSIPFSSLFFILLAFPLGLFSYRSGKSVGFGIGLFISALYWGLLYTGQSFGISTITIPPFLAIWAPNILVFMVGSSIFIRKVRQ